MSLQDILKDFEDQGVYEASNLKKAFKDIVAVTDKLPHPGHGHTYQRWQILSQVAASNLTLAKWYESHHDALSILHELNIENVPDGTFAVWAAEGSNNPLVLKDNKIQGEKLWCSGAEWIDYGLVTFKDEHQHSQLCLVNLHQHSIEFDHGQWKAVGMANTATAKITFNQVPVTIIGEANAYLTRPGFWHGAAGVAACWFGATVSIASELSRSYRQKNTPFNALYYGEVVTQLNVLKKYFQSVAQKIDAQPDLSHELEIRILRAQTEKSAKNVMEYVGNALGARPFCENAKFAHLIADLTVFLRQSHAAYDLARIAELSGRLDTGGFHDLNVKEGNLWML